MDASTSYQQELQAAETEVQETGVQSTQETTRSYPVYLIYSSWSLPEIRNFLEEKCHQGEYIGYLKVERSHGKESNRTLAILSPTLYQRLVESGFDQRNDDDFSIKTYIVPHYTNIQPSRTLFLPLPSEYPGSLCREQLEYKLNAFTSFGIIPQNGYRVRVSWTSRQMDQHRGSAFISFADHVPTDSISLTRSLLNGSNWEDATGEPGFFIKCMWSTKEHKGQGHGAEKNDRQTNVVLQNSSHGDARPRPGQRRHGKHRQQRSNFDVKSPNLSPQTSTFNN